jgi:hypothetical protein
MLQEEKIEATERDVDVDVSGDPNRVFFDSSEPFYVAGTEITVHVPFVGDAELFNVQPQTYNLNPPRAEVVGKELQLVFRLVQGQGDIKREYEDVLHRIREHLDWLRPSAEQLKKELRQLAVSEIQRRKQQFGQKKAAVTSLGVPMRQAVKKEGKLPEPVRMPVEHGSKGRATEEWDFFISHASEDKEAIAHPLAEALRNKKYEVWYDSFSLTVGDSLRESIDRGLARSRFGIVILSKAFFAKHWPARELNGLATREIDGKKVILPVWHGVTFEDVRNYSPMLADRLAVSTNRGLDHVIAELIKAL